MALMALCRKEVDVKDEVNLETCSGRLWLSKPQNLNPMWRITFRKASLKLNAGNLSYYFRRTQCNVRPNLYLEGESTQLFRASPSAVQRYRDHLLYSVYLNIFWGKWR
jgi:hypothetical protein